MNLEIRTAALALIVVAAPGCGGVRDHGPDQTEAGDTDVADEPLEPSGTWYIGHSIGQGMIQDGEARGEMSSVAIAAVDSSTEAPFAGRTFCNVMASTVLCSVTDANGRVVLEAPPSGRALAITGATGFVNTYFTVDPSEPADLSGDAYPIHTPESLDRLYESAGLERNHGAATVVLRVSGASAGTIAALVHDTEQTDGAVYADEHGTPNERLDQASADGTVYFFNVEPGAVDVTFGNASADCTLAPGAGWQTDVEGRVATVAHAGAVTYAGTIECVGAGE